MLKEFKEFINRGSTIDLAVGIIIGGAFTAIVNSLVGDLITPLISVFTGGIDFTSFSVTLGVGDNAANFRYGAFIQAIINFLLIAIVIFLLVKGINRLSRVTSQKASDETELTQKKCPYCKSEIPIDATRCPRCTSELDIG